MEPEHETPLEHGDRVAAARDLDTTQDLHIPEGTEGTVAEDRGSKLVVFFDKETKLSNLDERDLRKLEVDRQVRDTAPTCPASHIDDDGPDG